MIGNITFVKDSTTLQLCGSFILNSNKKKPILRAPCRGLLLCVYIVILIGEFISRIQRQVLLLSPKLAADLKTCLGSGETDRPARLVWSVNTHTRCGEGTSVHSLSPNLGLISSKDVQIKASRRTFYRASPPSVWSQTNPEPTRLHIMKHSTWGHAFSLKDDDG